MAIDVAVPRQPAARAWLRRPARVAAIPARFVLAGIVGVSFAIRLGACLGHAIPLYFSDEYIYSSIARSLAATGKPLVRGGPAHFPALLEPILAAPFWLLHDPILAYRLTQAEHSLAMSLAAVPAYLLARRLGLGQGFALGCAVVAVACPDLMYVSFILAEPIAYPLAMAAVYTGVCALERPSRRGQLAFLAFAGLATFARVQFVFLPLAFVAASLVVERGRVRAAFRSVRLTAILLAVPALGLLAVGPSKLLGYYSAVAKLHIGFGAVSWIGQDALLLAYAAGWILVPGAIVGIALAVARPASRAEAAFGGLVAISFVALFAEASLYASNGSDRFQERYLLLLLPLAAPAFGLCLRRTGHSRKAVPAIAFGLLLLSARIPLSGYTMADSKQDSPFLFAVFKLEQLTGVGTGSLAVAAVAALLALAACAVVLIPSRRVAALVALSATVAVAVAVSVAAISFDNRNTREIRASFLPSDIRWVDHAGLGGRVELVQTDGTPPEQPLEQLFWNESLQRVLLLGRASAFDAFAASHVRVTRDGRLLVHGRRTRRPLLVSEYGTQAQLTGVDAVRHFGAYTLYRPAPAPRLVMLTAGLYGDGWLAGGGRITVWPEALGTTEGTIRLQLRLPDGPSPMTLRLRGGEIRRNVMLRPGGHTSLTLPVHGTGPWILHLSAVSPGRLLDGRTISMKAERPVFVPGHVSTGHVPPGAPSGGSTLRRHTDASRISAETVTSGRGGWGQAQGPPPTGRS